MAPCVWTTCAGLAYGVPLVLELIANNTHFAGAYSYDTTAILGTREPLPLEAADLLPGKSESPTATSQYYTHGRKCEVTEFDERFHDAEEPVMLRYCPPCPDLQQCCWPVIGLSMYLNGQCSVHFAIFQLHDASTVLVVDTIAHCSTLCMQEH